MAEGLIVDPKGEADNASAGLTDANSLFHIDIICRAMLESDLGVWRV